jgi:hypothetical protein
MTMVLEAFEHSNGFSALTADELFFVNGGSSYSWSSGGVGNNNSIIIGGVTGDGGTLSHTMV